MDVDERPPKEKKKSRPKLNVEDLATRVIKSGAGQDYVEVCIKDVFDRIILQSDEKPVLPEPDISLCLPLKLVRNLNAMGITQLLPTQRYTLPLLTKHDTDLFVGASTGHGKTLAFLIPIAAKLIKEKRPEGKNRNPRALVISNTQVLQLQTYNVCKSLLSDTSLRVVLVCGETSMQEQRKAIDRDGVDIVIATTGRLIHFLKEKDLFLDCLEYYVYDEADKMTQGGAFKDAVTEISDFIPAEIRPRLRSCFFTATLDAIASFDNMYREDKMSVVRVPGNPLITHHIIPLDVQMDNDHEKSLILMRLLQADLKMQGRQLFDNSSNPFVEKTVVFVGMKWKCNYLAAYLKSYGFSVGVINSDLSLDMRNKIIQRFTDGEIQALIATDSMARGHDIPNVTHVINYDFSDLDTFKHRAGRTARIGHKGTCTTLLSRLEFNLYPGQSEMDPRRVKAAQLAHYLLLENGQRLPKCLEDSAFVAMGRELEKWGQSADPRVLLEVYTDKVKETLKMEEEERRAERKYQKEQQRSEERRMEMKESEPKRASLDGDGYPVFDASETERDASDEEDEDCGGVTVEYNDEEYWHGSDSGSDDEYGADSDSDAPKADYDDEEGGIEEPGPKLSWTDNEEDDEDPHEAARLQALAAQMQSGLVFPDDEENDLTLVEENEKEEEWENDVNEDEVD